MLEYIVDGGIRYRDGVYCSVDNLGTENMIRTHAAHVLLLQHTEFVLVVCTPVTYLICYNPYDLWERVYVQPTSFAVMFLPWQ